LSISLPVGKCLLSGQCLAVFVEHARGQVLVVRPSDCSPSNAYPLEILGILEPGKYAVPIRFHIENTFLPIFERSMELPVLEWLNSRNIEWESAFGNNLVFHSNNYTKGSILLICSPAQANFQLVMRSAW